MTKVSAPKGKTPSAKKSTWRIALAWTLGVVVILAIVLGIVAVVVVDTAGPGMAQGFLSQKTGFPVSSESFSIDALKGRVALKNFKIDNPASFGGGNFVTLSSTAVEVNVASLLGDTIRVHELSVHLASASMVSAGQDSNAKEFGQKLAPPATSTQQSAGTPKTAEPAKKVVIDHLKLQIDRISLIKKTPSGMGQPENIDLNFTFERDNVTDLNALKTDLIASLTPVVLAQGGPAVVREITGGLGSGIMGVSTESVQKVTGALQGLKKMFK